MTGLLRCAVVMSAIMLGGGGGVARAADVARDGLADLPSFRLDLEGPVRDALLTVRAEAADARAPIRCGAPDAFAALDASAGFCDLGPPADGLVIDDGPAVTVPLLYPTETVTVPGADAPAETRPGKKPVEMPRERPPVRPARHTGGMRRDQGGKAGPANGMPPSNALGRQEKSWPGLAGGALTRRMVPGQRAAYGEMAEAAHDEQLDDMLRGLPVVAAAVAGLLAMLAVQMRLHRRRSPES
jgi:hypothetical protein